MGTAPRNTEEILAKFRTVQQYISKSSQFTFTSPLVSGHGKAADITNWLKIVDKVVDDK